MFVQNTTDDLQLCLAGATGWVEMQSLELPVIPPELGNLSKVEHMMFKKCTLGAFPDEAFGMGSAYKQVKVDFYQCDFDADALFDRALDTGIANWKVRVFGRGNKAEPRWKTLLAIGRENEGQPHLRRAAYELLAGSITPSTPVAHVLPLMNHGKAPVRRAAASWLDHHLDAPELAAGTRVLVLGKPERLDRAEIKQLLEDRGWSVTRSPKTADAALVLPKPGKHFDAVLEQEVPLLVEAHLESTPDVPAAGDDEVERLDALLFATDAASTLLGLRLLGARQADAKLFADALALALFHDDKNVRKTARQLVETTGSDALRGRLAGDRRRYHTLEDPEKIFKAQKEFAKFGVDPIALAVAVVRIRELSEDHGHTDALTAALRVPGASRPALAGLSTVKHLRFESRKGFPEGLEQLTQMTSLSMYAPSKLTSDANVAALTSLPHPVHLELRADVVDLNHLLPLRDWLRSLSLSAPATFEHFELIARFTNLQALGVTRRPLPAIEPLLDLPLRELRMAQSGLSDLAPLTRLADTLQVLDISHHRVDLSFLPSLTGLQELHLDQTAVTDLSFVSQMPHLHTLHIWGAHVDDLAALAEHPALQVLHITHLVREGTVDVSALPTIPNLKRVHGVGTLTEADAEALVAARPNLWVHR